MKPVDSNKDMRCVSGPRSLGCRYGWMGCSECVPREPALCICCLQTSVFPIQPREVGAGGAGGGTEALGSGQSPGLRALTALPWQEQRWTELERWTGIGRNGPIQLLCCVLASTTRPHVLGCFQARQKRNSAFKGMVTFRHLKYFSFLSFFFSQNF